MAILFSTTGVQGTIIFNDLGGREFTHPIVNYDISLEYELEELRESTDFQNAITSGWITVKDENDNPIIDASRLDDRFGEVTSVALSTLTDVDLLSPIVEGSFLIYNSSTGKFESTPPAEIPGASIIEVYTVDETESITTNIEPTLKLQATLNISYDGEYSVETYFEMQSSASNKQVNSQVLVDGTEVMVYNTDTNIYQGMSGFYRISKTDGQTLNISINHNRITNGASSYIRRARIKVTRIV